MNLEINVGEYASDLISIANEEKSFENYEYYPVPPIKIVEAYINMVDDYNGRAQIKLSNGHTVIYKCKEHYTNNQGPEVKMSVTVEREGNTGYLICGNEFGEEYIGQYGSWINDIMKCYENYHKK